jgi:hypothetical protein
MSNFFIVKGELAAWALGLDQDDVVDADDQVVLRAAEPPALSKRRWRRMGHESYRPLAGRRRELAER